MKTPIECAAPGCDNQVGWYHTYSWGPNGQDPPEDDLFDDVVFGYGDDVFCSEECANPETLSEEATAVLSYDLIAGAQ